MNITSGFYRHISMHGKIVDICLFMDIVIEILGNTYRMMCGIIHSQLMTNEKKS